MYIHRTTQEPYSHIDNAIVMLTSAFCTVFIYYVTIGF